jgi:hypothetical protein
MLQLGPDCGTQVDMVKHNKQATPYKSTQRRVKMKKDMAIGIAIALGMLSVSAVSASAAGSCCETGKCTDKQVVQKFTQETSALHSALKAKDIELREQYGYEGIDYRKIQDLEAAIHELKGKIGVAGEKYGIPPCCRS